MEILLKKPTLTDIFSMQNMVKEDIENGNILPRSDNEVATNIRSYTCAITDDKIVGFVALHIHNTILAEIRSLVVDKQYRGFKIGKKLVQATLKEAKSLDIKEILVLTYKDSFFKKFGFEEIDKQLLPEPKIWLDCIKCKHFPVCDEVALIIDIAKIKIH